MAGMRIVFMGSADFAVPTLEALIDSEHEVLAVVTQLWTGRGPGQKIAVTSVKERALAAVCRFTSPKARTAEFAEWLKQLAPTVAVVEARSDSAVGGFGDPGAGCINVHASLLPRYRGSAHPLGGYAGRNHDRSQYYVYGRRT